MRLVVKSILVFVLASCTSTKPVFFKPEQTNNSPRKIVVFIDGTLNTASSYTNVSKMYNVTTLQDNENICATYIVGIGNHGYGILTGTGISSDVKKAYKFIAENYNPERKDEIYIFGFSRGAYASRILAGFIHVGGIVSFEGKTEKEKNKLVNKIYSKFKGKQSIAVKRDAIEDVVGYYPTSVSITFMGLWDTVAALGLPNFKEDYNVALPKYLDQLCNVERVAHAMAINDDRATLFTPKLLTERYLTESCDTTIDRENIVDEVWFFGSHSDVGGGYGDNETDGISFNWMLKQLRPYKLVPSYTKVYQDIYDITHEPYKGVTGLWYKKHLRSLREYAENSPYNNHKLKIHESVIQRLAAPQTESLSETDLHLVTSFPSCFESNLDGSYTFVGNETCALEIVN